MLGLSLGIGTYNAPLGRVVELEACLSNNAPEATYVGLGPVPGTGRGKVVFSSLGRLFRPYWADAAVRLAARQYFASLIETRRWVLDICYSGSVLAAGVACQASARGCSMLDAFACWLLVLCWMMCENRVQNLLEPIFLSTPRTARDQPRPSSCPVAHCLAFLWPWTISTTTTKMRVQGTRGRKGLRGRGREWRRTSTGISRRERMARDEVVECGDESEGQCMHHMIRACVCWFPQRIG